MAKAQKRAPQASSARGRSASKKPETASRGRSKSAVAKPLPPPPPSTKTKTKQPLSSPSSSSPIPQGFAYGYAPIVTNPYSSPQQIAVTASLAAVPAALPPPSPPTHGIFKSALHFLWSCVKWVLNFVVVLVRDYSIPFMIFLFKFILLITLKANPKCKLCSDTGFKMQVQEVKCQSCKGIGFGGGLFSGLSIQSCTPCAGRGWVETAVQVRCSHQ